MGFIDDAKGKAKQAVGDMTGDEKLKAEGNLDEAKGHVEDKANELKDQAGEKVNDLLGNANDKMSGDDK